MAVTSQIISQMISGIPQATDLLPGTDTTDFTQAATGTSKKFLRSDEFNFYFNAVGIETLGAVYLATTTNLNAIYNNGTGGIGATLTNAGVNAVLNIDGTNTVVGERILVWQQSNQAQNGIYSVTAPGDSYTPWILTRTTDYDVAGDVVQYQVVLVQQGLTYKGLTLQQIQPQPINMGTSAIVWVLFNILTPEIITFPLWISISSISSTMNAGNSYIANNPSGNVSFTLPTIAEVGTILQIAMGTSNSWNLAQNAGQSVRIGNLSSTIGSSGSWASSGFGDSLSIVCTVANTLWSSFASIGNLTYI
jgi:hypothetical protein